MSDLSRRLAHAIPPYPAPPNHIENDPTPKDQAIYVPSVSPGYAMDVHAQKWTRELPSNVGAGDLNFLDQSNPLFRISHVMSSAGQALNQPRNCIITQRDRSTTMLICDSGGYQIASGTLKIGGDQDRLKILQWLEKHADLAMTLDIPPGPVAAKKPGYPYATSKDCLDATLEHLKFFQQNRVEGKIRMLNVLQGNTLTESDAWYNTVKAFPFEGWAFAGLLRHNMYAFCRRIIIMAQEGQLQGRNWIHVLGTCELDTAVLLTALQRAINRHINPDLRISFDTSTPFRNLAFNSVYTLPKFDKKTMTMPTVSAPDGWAFVNSSLRWPWPSPLGDKMTLGDFCVASPGAAKRYRDTQSNHYMAHHNLAALCFGIALANRVFDGENVDHNHTIATATGAGVEAINQVIKAQTMDELDRYKKTFEALRHGSITFDSGDDERMF